VQGKSSVNAAAANSFGMKYLKSVPEENLKPNQIYTAD
jgi:hypothetical protein